MLSCKEMDNLAAVEIEISARVSTEEFDRTAKKLEAFIGRHGRVRVLEIVNHFEGMDAKAFWHDLKFSLRHLNDFTAAPSSLMPSSSRSGPPWSSRSSIARSPISSRKRWKPRGTGCFGLRAPPISSESTNLQSIVDLRSFP
jgi:hypothetical protein